MASSSPELQAARIRLQEFLAGNTAARVFSHPIPHPSSRTGFCFCDRSPFEILKMCCRGWLLETLLRLPFDTPKLMFLRRLGARIGQNVRISAGVWIDPLYPQLLAIEDNVLIGTQAKILFHEFNIDEFRVGQVVIGEGALVGGFSLIRCGIEIGRGAVVAGGSVVVRDVPPGVTVAGNPARPIGGDELC